MKIILFAIGLLFGVVVDSSQFAIVKRQMDIGIYVQCVPNREYDTICTYSTKKQFISYPGPSTVQQIEGIEKPIDALVFKAIKRSKKRKDVNAILTNDGVNAIAVQFKTKVKDIQLNRAIVNKYRNYLVFIMNKPSINYKVVGTVAIDKKLPLSYNGSLTIYSLMDSLINRFEKKFPETKADGFVTTNCTEADFILINKQNE